MGYIYFLLKGIYNIYNICIQQYVSVINKVNKIEIFKLKYLILRKLNLKIECYVCTEKR